MSRTEDLFELELRTRGIEFSRNPEDGRYEIAIGGWQAQISLDNVHRDYERDHDAGRITRFVDSIVSLASESHGCDREHLFWCLEPSDHIEPADLRAPISDRLDRVLIHCREDMSSLTWVAEDMLHECDLSIEEATEAAFKNLARILGNATIECTNVGNVRLGMVCTRLPFKASLIMAPNLKEFMKEELAWPLLAVVPDRNFLYLWDARERDLIGRVGPVVVEEYARASYPLCTEVFEISDAGIRAIGEFPVNRG